MKWTGGVIQWRHSHKVSTLRYLFLTLFVALFDFHVDQLIAVYCSKWLFSFCECLAAEKNMVWREAAAANAIKSLGKAIYVGTISVSPIIPGLGKGSIEKKRFLSGIARMMGGGSTHARIFWPSF